MSAPPLNPTISTIMTGFLREISAIDFDSQHNFLCMTQRGASAIISSYCLAFYDSPEDTSCANEAASTASSRFIQFLTQAQKEGGDTIILSQALPFSLKGRTNSKVIGLHPAVSKAHESFMKKLITKQLEFTDLVETYQDSSAERVALQDVFAKHWLMPVA